MHIKLLFGGRGVMAARGRPIQPICQAQCVRYCLLAMALQYLPFDLEAAPLASEKWGESANSKAETLADAGKDDNGLVTPTFGGRRNGSNSRLNGSAKGGSGIAELVGAAAMAGPKVI